MLNIIVSPFDKNQNASKLIKKVVKFFKTENYEYSVFFSDDYQTMNSCVKELTSNGETDFLIIGNDIALNNFLNSVKEISKIKLAIVPNNKNDDFARFINIGSNLNEILSSVISGEIDSIDFLSVNGKIVINNILIGASAEIFSIVEKYKIQNFLTRKYAEMKYGPQFEGVQLKFDFKNGKIKKENIFDLSVANGGLSKGNSVSPLANVKDGFFNLNYVVPMEENEKKIYLKSYKTGKQTYNEKTKQQWLNSMIISADDESFKAVVDGQVDTYQEMKIVLVEHGLKIFKKI